MSSKIGLLFTQYVFGKFPKNSKKAVGGNWNKSMLLGNFKVISKK